MVLIKFRGGSEWFKANWVFRQLVADVAAACPERQEVIAAMKRASAVGMLNLATMDETVGKHVLDSIEAAAKAVTSGNDQGWRERTRLDADAKTMYVNALVELLPKVKSEKEP